MPISTTVRLVNPANAADLDFCVGAASAAGLLWDHNTARSYAQDPNFHLGILIATWPERGISSRRVAMIQNARNRIGTGGRARTWLLAIDPAVIPDTANNARARIKIVDRLLLGMLERAVTRGTAKVDVGPITKDGKVHQYLATLPADAKTETDSHTTYVFDVQALVDALTSPGRADLYGGD